MEFFTKARRATASFNDDDDEYLQWGGRSDIAIRAELAFGVSGNDAHFAEGAGEGHEQPREASSLCPDFHTFHFPSRPASYLFVVVALFLHRRNLNSREVKKHLQVT